MAARMTAQEIERFHAHVYFRDAKERVAALGVRVALNRRFRDVTLGRVHDRALGPHPIPMYQVAFDRSVFEDLVPWLMIERRGLSVLIHPLTDDPLLEHSDFAGWLGTPIDLRLDIFSRQ